ncbi:PREDICTED: hydroxysteroid dehydrogenase-like protein 2 isoform X1 [Papilio polytes]|uniref:Hydroxysteroid dehydrogenase-like protein 2 n=1 Tax=Papilio polytes TaxID=76194 RepID=I4DMW6_PAPPL|nr:hydroxysteroid dehydrogenase-like protein 2 [Papilio polytes]BAM19256.1 short-chain dehydrogenase [Papilio polytes]
MSLVANTGKLAGRTLFITGASRGIGKAIALKAAKDGANVVIAAKTAEPHPKLPGTIYTAAEEIEALGGKALPCIVDVREEKQVQAAIDEAVKKFGGIDILVNNASAISLTGTAQTDMKRYDLMHNINTRGTYLASKLCLPLLKNSNHAHILNLSPPLNMSPYWFSIHVAYTMAKYGMSMCVLGMSEEFKPFNIGVNALWPKTAIATAAIEMLTGDTSTSRKPEIVSDAAYIMLSQDPKKYTGNFAIDEDVVKQSGIKDLTPYACDPKNVDNLLLDGFLDDPAAIGAHRNVTTASIRRYHTSAVNYSEKSEPEGQIPTLFGSISKVITPELVKKTQAIYQFNVKGKEEGVWHIDLKNGEGACGQGEPKNPPDATLTMDSTNFAEMFAGKLKPTTAFMMGKLKISGDLQKAMKLEKMMKSLKNKV